MADCKGLLIIVDGLGDRASAELGGLTPLEAASTPQLDRLAGTGITGLVDPLFPGMPVGTHTGTGILMGLMPKDAALMARGPVEAAGIGLSVGSGDVLLRCNFATLAKNDGKIEIRDRRAGRIREGTEELAKVLRDLPLGDGITGNLYPTTQHRAVLALSGDGLSASVTDTDPGSGWARLGVLPARPSDDRDPQAQRTANAVNRLIDEAQRRLAAHPVNTERVARGLPPANGVLTRSAGVAGTPRNLIRMLGLSASVITGEHTVEGLGRLFDFGIVSRPSFTALPQTDLSGKLAAAESELENRDLVFLHIKGPDICSHDRDPFGKKACLERIDAALAGLRRDDLVIGVTGDHSSDSNRGRHCGDPVPSLLYSPIGRRDPVERFDETACMAGGLGRIPATAFLLSLLDGMSAIGNYRPSFRDLVSL